MGSRSNKVGRSDPLGMAKKIIKSMKDADPDAKTRKAEEVAEILALTFHETGGKEEEWVPVEDRPFTPVEDRPFTPVEDR